MSWNDLLYAIYKSLWKQSSSHYHCICRLQEPTKRLSRMVLRGSTPRCYFLLSRRPMLCSKNCLRWWPLLRSLSVKLRKGKYTTKYRWHWLIFNPVFGKTLVLMRSITFFFIRRSTTLNEFSFLKMVLNVFKNLAWKNVQISLPTLFGFHKVTITHKKIFVTNQRPTWPHHCCHQLTCGERQMNYYTDIPTQKSHK